MPPSNALLVVGGSNQNFPLLPHIFLVFTVKGTARRSNMLLISSIWVKINKLYRLKSELFSYIVFFTIFTLKVWAEEVGNILLKGGGAV